MGIYPTVRIERLTSPSSNEYDVLLRCITEPGLERVEIYRLEAVIVNRADCFCCSCGDREGSDLHCRNHGWVGERPCETHDLPGMLAHPEDYGETGEPYMPRSVQAITSGHGE